jgi:hypothetical protein
MFVGNYVTNNFEVYNNCHRLLIFGNVFENIRAQFGTIITGMMTGLEVSNNVFYATHVAGGIGLIGDHIRFHHNQVTMVDDVVTDHATGASDVRIEDNVIRTNANAVLVTGPNTWVRGNDIIITANGGVGIQIYSTASAVTGCRIEDNRLTTDISGTNTTTVGMLLSGGAGTIVKGNSVSTYAKGVWLDNAAATDTQLLDNTYGADVGTPYTNAGTRTLDTQGWAYRQNSDGASVYSLASTWTGASPNRVATPGTATAGGLQIASYQLSPVGESAPGGVISASYSGNTSLGRTGEIRWASGVGAFGTPDVGLARASAGVLKVTDGGTGYGQLLAGKDAIGTTTPPADALAAVNTTAAVVSPGATVQNSPAIRWEAHAWETTGGTDDSWNWRSYVVPATGATTTSAWKLGVSKDGAAEVFPLIMASDGALTTNGGITANGNILVPSGTIMYTGGSAGSVRAGLNIAWTSASTVTSGNQYSLSISPSYNQATGTATNTDLLISRTQTAVGSGEQMFIDCWADTTTPTVADRKFAVASTGEVTAPSVSCSPTISSGTAAPGTTPAKVGDIYVDTTNHKLYFADGTTNSSNWVIAN